MFDANLTDRCRSIISMYDCHTVPVDVVHKLLENIDLLNQLVALKDERIQALIEIIDIYKERENNNV